MIQTYKNTAVKKGEEKGYFKFGGSTVVLFFEKDKIKIDADLLKNTEKGLETTIKMGERIAEKK
jgi:phosphatidylserine decarboxylase